MGVGVDRGAGLVLRVGVESGIGICAGVVARVTEGVCSGVTIVEGVGAGIGSDLALG